MLNRLCSVGHPGFQLKRVAVDSVLDDKRLASLLHLWQILKEWADVLCPEYKAILLFRREINGIDLSSIWIDHLARPGPQAIHKPLAVEGRYICFVAG